MKAKRVVSTVNLSHEDWLEWRRKGIGGSDVAAICNMSRYKSAMSVYLDKIGELPPLEDNPKMAAGRKMEPLIADWFADDTGYKVQKRNAIFKHPEYEFMFANIDRWLPGLNAGLECKNTSEYAKDDWAGTQAPTEYILQCNHYMAVTGAARWFIAVLIGGWNFQWRVIERDEELISNLITIESNFWHDNVQAKQPPAFSHQDSQYLNDLYPQSEPSKKVDLPETAYEFMQSLYEARKYGRIYKQQEEAAKNQLKGMIGDADVAYFQGDPVFTWRSNAKNRPFKVVGGEE
ncbi:endonuclease [Paenibacillus albicereus]|uniref:Endonuclease n=1 Tax=Paenibacillus albicereus TaxID=2726185 RepID=A0A6H2GZD0_9BACL|nr:YqaJ viral recombinase family protein [Paenibacillus albicereus]QJC52752.1 endonuclease [Paenibacillus albicereus]